MDQANSLSITSGLAKKLIALDLWCGERIAELFPRIEFEEIAQGITFTTRPQIVAAELCSRLVDVGLGAHILGIEPKRCSSARMAVAHLSRTKDLIFEFLCRLGQIDAPPRQDNRMESANVPAVSPNPGTADQDVGLRVDGCQIVFADGEVNEVEPHMAKWFGLLIDALDHGEKVKGEDLLTSCRGKNVSRELKKLRQENPRLGALIKGKDGNGGGYYLIRR